LSAALPAALPFFFALCAVTGRARPNASSAAQVNRRIAAFIMTVGGVDGGLGGTTQLETTDEPGAAKLQPIQFREAFFPRMRRRRTSLAALPASGGNNADKTQAFCLHPLHSCVLGGSSRLNPLQSINRRLRGFRRWFYLRYPRYLGSK
jgi:hypothetical protein